MDNRYRGNGNYQAGDYGRNWQEDQYASSGNRQPNDDWSGPDSAISTDRNRFDRGASQYRGSFGTGQGPDDFSNRRPAYERAENAFGYDHSRSAQSRPLDRQNFVSSSYGSGSYDSRAENQHYGLSTSRNAGGAIPPRKFDRDDRGFFDRASDEVMSWFGDDAAARRRQMDAAIDHRGKGPKGYTRSSERILEDANERLMHDREVDASGISVTCADCEITLDGTVNSRHEKRRAEEIVDDISGVKHVQNNLRVTAADSYYTGETAQPTS